MHQGGNQHQGTSKQKYEHHHQQPHLGHGHGHGRISDTSFTIFEKGFIREVALDFSAAPGDTNTMKSESKNTGISATRDLSRDTIISDITQSTSPYANNNTWINVAPIKFQDVQKWSITHRV